MEHPCSQVLSGVNRLSFTIYDRVRGFTERVVQKLKLIYDILQGQLLNIKLDPKVCFSSYYITSQRNEAFGFGVGWFTLKFQLPPVDIYLQQSHCSEIYAEFIGTPFFFDFSARIFLCTMALTVG